MKVFISWSGERSRAIAEALKVLIEDVLPDAEPWVSSQNVQPGEDWWTALSSVLSQSGFGILCFTEANLAAPWIAFEAGALSKAFGESHVSPYLIDLKNSQLPLLFSRFQAATSDKQGTLKLVHSINKHLKIPRPGDPLTRTFNKSWPYLSKSLIKSRELKDPPSLVDQLLEQLRLQGEQLRLQGEQLRLQGEKTDSLRATVAEWAKQLFSDSNPKRQTPDDERNEGR